MHRSLGRHAVISHASRTHARTQCITHGAQERAPPSLGAPLARSPLLPRSLVRLAICWLRAMHEEDSSQYG
jgi:hypothetical protein